MNTTTKTKKKAALPQSEILKWSGLMGHRFAVIEPSNSDHAKLYNGWRCKCECNALRDACETQAENVEGLAEVWEQTARGQWKRRK